MQLDKLSVNGAGLVFMKKLKDIKKHHLHAKDMLILPPGTAFQCIFNVKCLVLQIPFLPINQHMTNICAQTNKSAPEYGSPYIR